jgi:ABC-type transport system involved in cytochrome bd biosynthesis fused ATPase/permease subunit
VDIHVATSIMEKTVKEHLRGKTILMATHAIKFARLADYIILMRDGRVEACSTYD